ncbi:hypothetical protein GCM10017673_03010 [Streptosporangium violaceochromogenes]|nr:hypothetical protein GCM10017673_03010 [Streptosporangium violaceochromogenes]
MPPRRRDTGGATDRSPFGGGADAIRRPRPAVWHGAGATVTGYFNPIKELSCG